MENIILGVVALLALYYIYIKTFKNSGCNCGSAECKSKNKDA
ncbi:FeoB-associated Cys-rich membrane protein [Candidatus Marinarcus aquaticus]|uniref:FeoB-associated Cys-rich membrane protein n=1 Tax=Candidatus Marinarcus aquaticus TaxID=2044504 RepID=A0A4Q0XT59_9BACT|nr:FeoB-associated Cys-rich membrane protein [Candidatus Marinarcus aquaticus]